MFFELHNPTLKFLFDFPESEMFETKSTIAFSRCYPARPVVESPSAAMLSYLAAAA